MDHPSADSAPSRQVGEFAFVNPYRYFRAPAVFTVDSRHGCGTTPPHNLRNRPCGVPTSYPHRAAGTSHPRVNRPHMTYPQCIEMFFLGPGVQTMVPQDGAMRPCAPFWANQSDAPSTTRVAMCDKLASGQSPNLTELPPLF